MSTELQNQMKNACRHGNLNRVIELLNQGAPLNALKKEDPHPAWIASYYGNLNILEYLVSQGADIHYDYSPAIDGAVQGGNLNICQYLLNSGVNIRDDPITMYRACMSTKPSAYEIIELLYEHGGIINCRSADGDHIITSLATIGDIDKLKFLFELGASPNVDSGGPLQYACIHGEIEVVKLLLDYGARVNVYKGRALKLAKTRGHRDIAQLLINWGANPQ